MTRHFATRREFLQIGTVGLSGMAFAAGRGSQAQTSPGESRPRAQSTILLFLCGGASHLDTWDLKPKAPIEYRGPFQPIETSAPGVTFCEHLPLLAQQAHHLAVVNSVDGQVNTNDHHAGYYHNLTGHRPDQSFVTLGNNRTPFPSDWPFMGSVVGSKCKPHPVLPNAISLPHKPSKAPYTRPGQFAGRLGVEHNPLYVQGSHATPLEFTLPALTLAGDVTPDRLASREVLLGVLDSTRRGFDDALPVSRWSTQRERAASLLMASSTTRAFDVSREPLALRERYGSTVNGTSLLAARRLVEEGVPFVTVFWYEDEGLRNKCKSAGGWDTHGNNFDCLKQNLLPELDRGLSALLADLHDRGLLEQTLVMVTSEMGRKPQIGDPRSGGVSGQGRDHWTHCLTDLLAGGGIRGGQTYGATDRLGGYPADLPVTPADITRTVYHAMGIDDLTAQDKDGRVYNLLQESDVIEALF
ncbi:MAG: DUF1501 domain-containing protein [Planctomycetota bacterium]|nr:DUF1501 domain-containing protein [Planctomycetota bacterium]